MTLPEVQHFIANYGYYAVFAGAILEGETVLLLASVAASSGLLELPWVIFFAGLSATTSDNANFWLGRWQGPWILRKFPSLAPRFDRFGRLLERWHTPVIVVLRFLYGLRTVGPIAVGMSGMAGWRFLLIDLVSAYLWAGTFSTIGFLLGQRLMPWLSQPGAARSLLLGLLGVVAVVALLVTLWRRRARPAS